MRKATAVVGGIGLVMVGWGWVVSNSGGALPNGSSSGNATGAAPAKAPLVAPATRPSRPSTPAPAGATAAHPDGRIQSFVTTYCADCHGPKVQKADRRFDQLKLPAKDHDTLVDLQDMLDAMNLGDMPPKKAKQPSAAELKDAVALLTASLETSRDQVASTGADTVLRRINRREYINTVGDLFGMNMSLFDPTVKFPRDQVVEHMDNIGDGLRTSGYLLEQYLAAADQVVTRAFASSEAGETKSWTFKDKFFQQPEVDRAQGFAFQNKYLCLYESLASDKHEGAYAPIKAFAEGVPADGYYEIKVKAEAKNRKNDTPEIFKIDPSDQFVMGLVPGNEKAGTLHLPQPVEPLLAEWSLGDAGPEWKTARVWLDAGYTPRFVFLNGMPDVRNVYAKVASKFKGKVPADPLLKPGGIVANRMISFKFGAIPHIRIHEIQIRGPFRDPAATSMTKLLFGGKAFDPAAARQTIQTFATRAYRRPATTDETDRLFALYNSRVQDGEKPIEALQDALKAILCSPSFLYLSESTPSAANKERLSGYDLASRLSYFLWSTMPDAELLHAAETGELQKPDVLRAQARRLLASPRSDAFVKGFIDSWLNLRALGDMPPDRNDFPLYYRQNLQSAMYTETELFTRNLVDKNQSLVDFIDSDYGFINRPLAHLYKMEDVVKPTDGNLFRKVKFTDRNRGGLLGQASILTVSANGVETSPVTRGVWLLENILGTPPSPPPDNVPPIDPDVRGAKSIRDLLTKHRSNATCMECHQKIDPLGFALESFDPIGAFRTTYHKSIPIDTAGVLPSGESFKDLAGLKKILLLRKDQFARMLAERLLTYGCGRRMEAVDRQHIDSVVAKSKAENFAFRSLIEDVVLSETFQSE